MRERAFVRTAWGTLAFTVAVIAWGAYVRATGSGAGCGKHWPLCNGEVVPHAPSTETLIELTHRVTSGVSLLLVVGLAWWARRLFPARHGARRGALAALAFMIGEALLGAGLVLLGLVTDDDSTLRAVMMAVHLANTFLLLASLTLTAQWATTPPAPGRSLLTAGGLAALAAYLLIGVSGAVAALGDTLFPATSLAEGLRLDLAPTAHVLVRLRLHHPWIAVVAAIGIAMWVNRHPTRGPLVTGALLLLASQLALGAVNVVLLAPVWMQLVHLVVADATWIVLVLIADDVAQGFASVDTPASTPRRPSRLSL
jgi:heme A synthase